MDERKNRRNTWRSLSCRALSSGQLSSGAGAMSEINTGGPAFPEDFPCESGMTLRDYFAAKAMQGFCAADDTGEWSPSFMADSSYKIADAMLKARDQ